MEYFFILLLLLELFFFGLCWNAPVYDFSICTIIAIAVAIFFLNSYPPILGVKDLWEVGSLQLVMLLIVLETPRHALVIWTTYLIGLHIYLMLFFLF